MLSDKLLERNIAHNYIKACIFVKSGIECN
jgi:hypothetical protein